VRIAIVGGGLAGLAAGTALAGAGHEVELFERSRLLGGRATSFEIDGVEVDNGQHVFLGCCDAFIDFVRRTGLGDSLYLQERFEAIVVDRGRASRLRAGSLPAPWHLVTSFLHFGLLSAGGKIAVARALAAASRNGDARDESFAAWLARQRQSDETIRAFWKPFFVPALNVPLEEMDAQEALFTLRTAFLNDARAARFGYSKIPLARIAEAAAKSLSCVHRSTSISSLSLEESAASALVTTAGERHAFDAFVLAVTPRQLDRLLGDSSRYGIASLSTYVPHPIVDVHLRYSSHPERSERDFSFAALVDSPIQWVFKKGEGYLVCSMSAAGDYVRRTNEALIAFAWAELQAAMTALRRATLEKGAVTRNPEATFSAPPKTVRPGPATAIENVFIAGSWTATGWPDTMESAVRSGAAAAAQIIEHMGAMAR
jgi:squalene-associated FAD-dependent desaturase